MPPNAKDSQELAPATLRVWGTCSSVSANRTYLTIVQPLACCELMVKTKSASKQAEAVEIQFNNRFDEDAHVPRVGGENAPALDWPPFPIPSQ